MDYLGSVYGPNLKRSVQNINQQRLIWKYQVCHMVRSSGLLCWMWLIGLCCLFEDRSWLRPLVVFNHFWSGHHRWLPPGPQGLKAPAGNSLLNLKYKRTSTEASLVYLKYMIIVPGTMPVQLPGTMPSTMPGTMHLKRSGTKAYKQPVNRSCTAYAPKSDCKQRKYHKNRLCWTLSR